MGIQIDGINNRVTTGDIVSQTGSFSSDVGIGGTLTYEDVSNIDSVGVITARSGISVTSGSIGINTTGGNEKLNVFGAIRSSGSSANFNAGLEGTLVDYDIPNRTSRIGHVNGASGSARPLAFLTGGSERVRITSSGAVGINTTVDAATKLQVQTDGTSTTVGGNVVARFQSNGSGRDATIQLSDNVANSATISMLSSSLLFKQAGTETLRISPGGSIGVSHNLAGTANYNRLMLHNPHDGSCWLQMTSTASGNGANTDGLSIGLNQNNVAHIWQRENAKMAFATNGTSRMEISANGIVTKPNTPAFRAHDSNHAQNGFLTFDQIATNVGSHYNGSNGRFTVPIAGTYFFSFYGMLATSSGNARVEYYINGSVHSSGEHYGGVAYTNGTTYNLISCNTVLTLSQNDYVNLNWNTSYNSMHSYHNGFMGFLIG